MFTRAEPVAGPAPPTPGGPALSSVNHLTRLVLFSLSLSVSRSSIAAMTEGRREALAAAAPEPTTASSSTAGSNTTNVAGRGAGENDEAFSKLKDKFMNELNKIPCK